jgi:exopolysaccharide production protein ExoZ
MKSTIISIQILRALAALLVVFHHARYQISEFEDYFADGFWLFGQAGVDIFFVISGFIMWVTTHDRPTTPLRFMTNRIVRIVPLYWLITLAVAAMAFAVPSLFRGVVLTPEHVIKSLLFIPHCYPGMSTRVWPLLLPGWTLNYEMVFYLVFAIALLLPRRLMIPLIAALFTAVVAAGFIFDFDSVVADFYTESIILEFVTGMMLGHLWLQGKLRISPPTAFATILVAFAVIIALTPFKTPESRFLIWGLPALLVVSAGLALEPRGRFVSHGSLKLMGDASYSIYLTHILTLGVLRTAWRWLGLIEHDPVSAWTFLIVSIAVSALAGIAVYYVVEIPMLRFFRRLGSGARADSPMPAGAASR